MADRDVAVQRFQTRLGEYLRDQAHVLVDNDVRTVADRDSRRFLTAVLERIQAEISEFGDFLARRPDPEDAACVLRSTLPREDVVR